MPNVSTSYGPGGGASTSMGLSGLNVPPPPDFWGNMRDIVRRLKPQGAAQDQAAALRQQPEPVMPMRGAGPELGVAGPPPQEQRSPYENWTPRSFGHPSMSPQGRLGTYVNPLDVPLQLQGSVPTGFYEDSANGNHSYSPTSDPRRYGQPAGGRG